MLVIYINIKTFLIFFRFLDQYYQQFDQRVQPSLERSDLSGNDADLDITNNEDAVFQLAKSFPADNIDSVASSPTATVSYLPKVYKYFIFFATK